MVNRLVSVGDDFTIPPAVKVADPNLPARLQDTALNATYGPSAPGMLAAIDDRIGDSEVIGPAITAYVEENGIVPTSGPDVITWTNSLWAQGGGSNPRQDVGGFLAALTGLTVLNAGVGGETSDGIAARHGAIPYMMTPAGGSIPASGAVNVTFKTAAGVITWPLLQVWGNPSLARTLVGYLKLPNGQKVSGTLALVKPSGDSSSHAADDYYTFTRAGSGTAIALAHPAPFYVDYADANLGAIHGFDVFYNNVTDGDVVFDELEAMILRMHAVNRRFFVMLPHVGYVGGADSARVTATTAARGKGLRKWGRNAIDIHDYLMNYGLAAAGLTPTMDDTADIAAGWVPRQLLTDGTHFTVAARQVIAAYVAARFAELGWIAAANTVPLPVAGLAAAPGDGSMALTWTEPDSGGSAITDYAVQYKISTDALWTTFAHAASTVTAITVTGLTNELSYDFRVAAVNAIGQGTFSSTVFAMPLHSVGITGLDHRYVASKMSATATEPAVDSTVTTWYDNGSAHESIAATLNDGILKNDGGFKYLRMAITNSPARAATLGKAWADTSKPRTMIAVMRLSATTVYALNFCGYRVRRDASGNWELNNGTEAVTVAGNTAWALVVARLDGANSRLHVDALTSAAPGTAFAASGSTGAPTGIALGTGSSGTTINADFREIATVARFIDSTELAAVRTALKAKYTDLP